MAPKKKRQIQKSNKAAKSWKLWPDLPLYRLIKPLLWQNEVTGGIWKSLRARTKSCLYNKNSANILPYWVELPDFHCSKSHFHCAELPDFHFWNSSHVFIMEPDLPSGFYPSTCAIFASTFLSKRQPAFVFTGISHPAFLFSVQPLFRESPAQWIKQDCSIVDPNAPIAPHEKKSAYLQFTSAIEFKGKVYALSLYGTITVIEVTDSCPSITSLGKSRAFPSLPLKHFKEYLLRSEEEILLVFQISKRSMKIVDDLEILRLDCDTLSWDKVHSLGDKAVLVGAHSGVVASSVKARCRKNCVYFHHGSCDDKWWMFDMESHQVSVQPNCLENIEDG